MPEKTILNTIIIKNTSADNIKTKTHFGKVTIFKLTFEKKGRKKLILTIQLKCTTPSPQI